MIVVAGTARSGTSITTRILCTLGVDMAPMGPNFEDHRVIEQWWVFEEQFNAGGKTTSLSRDISTWWGKYLVQRGIDSKGLRYGVKNPFLALMLSWSEDNQWTHPGLTPLTMIRPVRPFKEVIESCNRLWPETRHENNITRQLHAWDNAMHFADRRLTFTLQQLRETPRDTITKIADACRCPVNGERFERAVEMVRR